jgi:aspartate beta-hydroxylase
MVHMQWALRQAQQRGDWLDSRTTPHWLQDHVGGAVAFVARHPQERLGRALGGAGGDVRRVESFIRGQLGLERIESPDPRQAPKKHRFPGLPATPWFDPALFPLFPWASRLREAFPVILAEYLAVAGGEGGFEPFLNFRSAEQVARHLGTTGPAPEWNAFFFYRHGERYDENCRRCPQTAAVLDALPLIQLPGSTPEICFSVLTPGSHILPHRGDSTLRSVVHLGLVIPPDCALKVAGEERTWKPGEVLAFDDTYEHEAWNRSGAVRAVLLMDAWNPHLTEVERAVLPRVIGTMNEIAAETERLRPRAPQHSA